MREKFTSLFCCLCIWVYVYGCVNICLDEIQGVEHSQQVDRFTLKILTLKLTSKSIELVFLRLDSLMI